MNPKINEIFDQFIWICGINPTTQDPFSVKPNFAFILDTLKAEDASLALLIYETIIEYIHGIFPDSNVTHHYTDEVLKRITTETFEQSREAFRNQIIRSDRKEKAFDDLIYQFLKSEKTYQEEPWAVFVFTSNFEMYKMKEFANKDTKFLTFQLMKNFTDCQITESCERKEVKLYRYLQVPSEETFIQFSETFKEYITVQSLFKIDETDEDSISFSQEDISPLYSKFQLRMKKKNEILTKNLANLSFRWTGLESNTIYDIDARAITLDGLITKWSEPQRTEVTHHGFPKSPEKLTSDLNLHRKNITDLKLDPMIIAHKINHLNILLLGDHKTGRLYINSIASALKQEQRIFVKSHSGGSDEFELIDISDVMSEQKYSFKFVQFNPKLSAQDAILQTLEIIKESHSEESNNLLKFPDIHGILYFLDDCEKSDKERETFNEFVPIIGKYIPVIGLISKYEFFSDYFDEPQPVSLFSREVLQNIENLKEKIKLNRVFQILNYHKNYTYDSEKDFLLLHSFEIILNGAHKTLTRRYNSIQIKFRNAPELNCIIDATEYDKILTLREAIEKKLNKNEFYFLKPEENILKKFNINDEGSYSVEKLIVREGHYVYANMTDREDTEDLNQYKTKKKIPKIYIKDKRNENLIHVMTNSPVETTVNEVRDKLVKEFGEKYGKALFYGKNCQLLTKEFHNISECLTHNNIIYVNPEPVCVQIHVINIKQEEKEYGVFNLDITDNFSTLRNLLGYKVGSNFYFLVEYFDVKLGEYFLNRLHPKTEEKSMIELLLVKEKKEKDIIKKNLYIEVETPSSSE